MANSSIYSAFERMWQHIVYALGNKSDVGHTHNVVSTTADGFAPKRDGSTTKFLRGDGTWATPATGSTITVDSSLSSTSTNPVQNKVVYSALNDKLSTTGTAAKATADASGNNIVNTYATKSALTTVENKLGGCWISFTDENGRATDEPYIHWYD